ncbi:MAG: hypothetical protein KC419_03160 [Anaerolineales bacterium]|nr:hypothetical protein [Anaerolineales bacterium]MCA9927444.1 hypothetical protein [Anaerolineales bacterium]
MPEANYTIGESFPVQFAWKLPNQDYLRAVFEAKVLEIVPAADKYIVRLTKLIAGRQENKDGELRHRNDYSKAHWAMVGALVGNKITIAYEVQDGHALHMRLATLTGEHNFFTRYEKLDEVSAKVQKILDSRKRSEPTPEDIV